MERIDKLGGILKCVEDGAIQKQLAHQAYEIQKKFESKEMVKVGANRFQIDEEEKELEVFEVDPQTLIRQIGRLEQIKAERDNIKLKNALETLQNAAYAKKNLMPYIMEAVRSYATVGEIVGKLKEVYGEAKQASIL